MPIVADASVAIRGDMSGFKQDLRGAEAEVGGLGAKLQNALSFKNLLRTGALFGLGTTIPGMLRDVIGAAGDAAAATAALEQTGKSVERIFQGSAETIRAWADQAAESAGLSKQRVFEAATVMGQTLLNMGFSAQAAALEVVTLQQRAADLAIAFGQKPEDAILAISAALRGERDTIEKFGVSLTEALVQARIHALGLSTATPEAERYAKAVATLDLVMEQSAKHAHAFANSQGDIAGKTATAQARIDNFMAESFGPAVVSIQLGAIQVADAFLDIGDGIGDFFDNAFNPEKQAKAHDLANALGISFWDAKDQIRLAMQETGQDYDTVVDGMIASAYELGEEGAESFDHFTAAFTAMGDRVDDEADGIATAIPRAVLEHWDEIRQAGVDALSAYRAGVDDPTERQSFLDEIDGFLKDLDEALEPGEYISELHGRKMELAFARGVAVEKGDLGAVAAIDAMLADVYAELNTLNGYSWGYNLVDSIDQGMKDRVIKGISGAYALGTVIRRGVGINSEPEDPNSPLRGITKWGGNIVKTIADGIYGELGTGQAATAALAGALVPSISGALGAGGPSTVGAGSTTQYILNVEGQPKLVGSRDQILDAWMQMSQAGDSVR